MLPDPHALLFTLLFVLSAACALCYLGALLLLISATRTPCSPGHLCLEPLPCEVAVVGRLQAAVIRDVLAKSVPEVKLNQTEGCFAEYVTGMNFKWPYPLSCMAVWLYSCNAVWLYGCTDVWP